MENISVHPQRKKLLLQIHIKARHEWGVSASKVFVPCSHWIKTSFQVGCIGVIQGEISFVFLFIDSIILLYSQTGMLLVTLGDLINH